MHKPEQLLIPSFTVAAVAVAIVVYLTLHDVIGQVMH